MANTVASKVWHYLHMRLEPLSQASVVDLVKHLTWVDADSSATKVATGDAATTTIAQLEELGGVVYAKTAGNPFFVHQFMRQLYVSTACLPPIHATA